MPGSKDNSRIILNWYAILPELLRTNAFDLYKLPETSIQVKLFDKI